MSERKWINVLDKSTFHLGITNAAAQSVACARDGKEIACSQAPQVLRSPDRYQWYVIVEKASASTEVKAWIEKPDGTRHGSLFTFAPTGNAGTRHFVFLSAITQ